MPSAPLVARVLLGLSLLQVLLAYVPALSWPLWMAHFVALETCLLGVVTGLAALVLSDEPLVRVGGVCTAVAALLPALLAAPGFLREGAPFSVTQWLGAAPAAPGVEVRTDVPLGDQLVDVYGRPGPQARPWVMVIHGGSWRSGDKGDAPQVSLALAARGWVVFDVRYRLAPASPFPAAIEDIWCMLADVSARAATLGVDPARGALLGRSAGGQIALVAGYAGAGLSSRCPAPAPLRAVVSVYGPTDMAWAHANPYVPDVVDGTAALEAYLGGPPAAAPQAYRDATPMTWVGPTTPPTLLIHGTAERCVRPDNAARLETRLRAAGRPVKTVFVPLADHGFDIRRGGLGEQLSRSVILDFLEEHL